MLSFEQIGAAAMLSRAIAGSADRTAIFVMPGSSGAVKLALERLILPELPHLVGQLQR
jgi:molybdenum cofactor biosynthesis protein B